MDTEPPDPDQPVVAITGGGGGIGAAVARELGRQGHFVVTMDPLVTLDGSERIASTELSTAERIVADGGRARATAVSVTDADAVDALFAELVDRHGRLDAVINVAGITRPTSFASGDEPDWGSVLAVHLDGYRNVLDAAVPRFVAAGHGCVLGVTSGSGWRPANTGAYGCAKRAVAALTWQLGAVAPPGVVVNAMSPIAVTRMVTAALGRRPPSGGSSSSATGGLSLGSMPEPDDLGPLGAHLVDPALAWCRGRVIFAGGTEVALVDPPRLLEVVRTDATAAAAHALEVFTAGALVSAEQAQASGGGSNPRFGADLESFTGEVGPGPEVRSCIVVTDRPELATTLTRALDARSIAGHVVTTGAATDFAGAASALAGGVEQGGPVDAVVVATSHRSAAAAAASPWERVLAEHRDLVGDILTDVAWVRAATEATAAGDRPVRLVVLTDATTTGGRSRAQASAQLARSAGGATDGRVTMLPVSVEGMGEGELGALAAHLVGSGAAGSLSGAELVAGPGWFGLRSHPRPIGSITLGGTELPAWFDTALRDIAGVTGPQ